MEGIEEQQNNTVEWGHVMSQLRNASQHCAQRGLLYAAKWQVLLFICHHEFTLIRILI